MLNCLPQVIHGLAARVLVLALVGQLVEHALLQRVVRDVHALDAELDEGRVQYRQPAREHRHALGADPQRLQRVGLLAALQVIDDALDTLARDQVFAGRQRSITAST
jgi:hypothetical protein